MDEKTFKLVDWSRLLMIGIFLPLFYKDDFLAQKPIMDVY